MELIRGKWSKKYINCPEDKRDYDIMRRGYMRSHDIIAANYCRRFSPPELTAEEMREIAEYWAEFGIKMDDYTWHRMYYHATGNHDPRFVPDLVAGLILYEYYNDRAYEGTWRDKNMFHRLLPEMPLPEALFRRIRGRYVTEESGYLAETGDCLNRAAALIWHQLGGMAEDIVVKKSRDTGFGKGVSKYRVTSEEDIRHILEQWSDCNDYVVQRCVRPHPVLASLNEHSSNMIRICSWRHGNEVEILYAGARVGAGKSFTDVSFVEGEERVHLVGISPDGVFADKMVDQYGRYVKALPKQVPVPAWEQIVSLIRRNHLLLDNFDLVGWDFTVDEEGSPVCFEWNISWPGTVLYQFANGRPLYGDKTERLFAFLKQEKNRDFYIPYYMKLK